MLATNSVTCRLVSISGQRREALAKVYTEHTRGVWEVPTASNYCRQSGYGGSRGGKPTPPPPTVDSHWEKPINQKQTSNTNSRLPSQLPLSLPFHPLSLPPSPPPPSLSLSLSPSLSLSLSLPLSFFPFSVKLHSRRERLVPVDLFHSNTMLTTGNKGFHVVQEQVHE